MVLLCSSVPVPIVDLKAVAGDPVYLPCDIKSPDKNDQVLLVLWYREDLGTPIYRFVLTIIESAKL